MKTTTPPPSVSHSFTIRLAYPNHIGTFARVVSTIGKRGGDLGAVDIVSAEGKLMTRDITVRARNEAHQEDIVAAVRRLAGVKVINVSDRVFLLHLGGKLAIRNKVPLTTRDTLSMAYTPGVARVCEAIAAEPRKAWQLTIKANAVAVVSDGTAVLGLGDIGPAAAMPVMEGKAMLFKEFAGIDAYPICLSTKDPEEIIQTVKHLSVGFGGINLEDISAPRCFEIERRLQEQLDIPVFHDDQHGTAVVVLAALLNALRLTGQRLERLKIVISGAGAAGVAVTRILLRGGARDIIVCDREGMLEPSRLPGLNESKTWLAQNTNPRKLRGHIRGGAARRQRFHWCLRPRDGSSPPPQADGVKADHLRAGQSESGNHAGGSRPGGLSSWQPAGAIIRIKSTTCWRFRGSSAAHWMCGRDRSPKA